MYKRYVGLYVIMGVDRGDNEHLAAAAIHFFVELLDKYFGTVRELDLIYEFESCYRILDEFIFAGEVYCEDKQAIVDRIHAFERAVKKSKREHKRR